MQAGCELIGGIELNEAIGICNQSNLEKFFPNHNIHITDVTLVNPIDLPKPDILWASPPCTTFSKANRHNTKQKDTHLDLGLAVAIVLFIKTWQPNHFILENVQAYGRSKSLALIESTLIQLGYFPHREIYNAADFGVPQSRVRVILRASKGKMVSELNPMEPHNGWLSAIADLVDDLPETKFAQWQLDKLPDAIANHLIPRDGVNNQRLRTTSSTEPQFDAFLIDTQQYSRPLTIKASQDPIFTIAGGNHCHKAFLVHPTDQRAMPVVTDSDPSFTIMASPSNKGAALLIDGKTNHEKAPTVKDEAKPSFVISASAYLENGRVVRINEKCLARFQTLPDWYVLPDKKTIACRLIGNGVPCLMAQRIVESLIL